MECLGFRQRLEEIQNNGVKNSMQASRTSSRQAPALQEQNRETELDGQPIVHWTQKGCRKEQIKVPGEKDGNVYAKQSVRRRWRRI